MMSTYVEGDPVDLIMRCDLASFFNGSADFLAGRCSEVGRRACCLWRRVLQGLLPLEFLVITEDPRVYDEQLLCVLDNEICFL